MIRRHVFTTVWCDFAGCLESFELELTARETVKEARRDGWSSGKRQLCPLHSRPVVSPESEGKE